MIDREIFFVVIAAIAITFYLGLAVHVVTHSPRRPIGWVFAAFCLIIINYYLTSLFLIPGLEPPSPVTPLALRCKWAGLSLGPVFFLHLMTFYFPLTWRPYRYWLLLPAYVVSIGLALAALFTNLMVAGPLYRTPPNIIGPIPGPLMYVFATVSAVLVIGGTISLLGSYRLTPSPSFRRQILYLFIPTGLIILSGLLNWTIVLTQDTGNIPPELVHLIFFLIAFFYTHAVVRYGSFAGRPLARRNLFYSMLNGIIGLAALVLTLMIDRWLITHTAIPYPLTTGMLVVVVAAGFLTGSRWITGCLDPILFRTERHQLVLAQRLAEILADTPDPDQLQEELLNTLCTVLEVQGGYVAFTEPDLPPETLRIGTVLGNLPVRVGDLISQPPVYGSFEEPQLVRNLPFQIRTEPGWAAVVLFCPLNLKSGTNGILALAEKRDGSLFNQAELALCDQLAKQLDVARQMRQLHIQRAESLEITQRQSRALQQLAAEVTTSTQQALVDWEKRAVQPVDTPLEIRLLGPLQIIRNGQPVSEAAWGTQKAKALLAYLLWKGPTGATREEISSTLWPNRSVDETANVFHVTLHHLRRVLEPELNRGRDSCYILYERGRYCFNFDTPHWLDISVFEKLAASTDVVKLRQAVGLYREPCLADADWDFPPEVEVERRRLEQLYADTLRRLAAQTNGATAIAYLEKLVEIEPTDETAQRALILSYLAHNRRDLARQQVVRWQQILAEFDLKPSPETRVLWEQIEKNAPSDHNIIIK